MPKSIYMEIGNQAELPEAFYKTFEDLIQNTLNDYEQDGYIIQIGKDGGMANKDDDIFIENGSPSIDESDMEELESEGFLPVLKTKSKYVYVIINVKYENRQKSEEVEEEAEYYDMTVFLNEKNAIKHLKRGEKLGISLSIYRYIIGKSSRELWYKYGEGLLNKESKTKKAKKIVKKKVVKKTPKNDDEMNDDEMLENRLQNESDEYNNEEERLRQIIMKNINKKHSVVKKKPIAKKSKAKAPKKTLNKKMCKEFMSNKLVNPLTGKKIKKDGPTYKTLMKECAAMK